MTPAEFEAEREWLGWQAMAARAFNLRPAEVHALALMMRTPGRTASLASLAAFDGVGSGSRNVSGSRVGIAKRIERVRSKLLDVGCGGVVETVAEHRFAPTLGYRISPDGARRVEAALRFAHGVELEIAA